MRGRTVVFLVILAAVLCFILTQIWTLLSLLVVNGAEDRIARTELDEFASDNRGPPVIPKIIHQTYKNETIPEVWREAHQSCLDLHPDYEYKLWTDDASREFIANEYPDFLETWDNYPYVIERADAIRYFVLSTYGGIYIDLDDGCKRKLDPLLSYPAWVRRTKPTGISNDVMGSVPGHPFFKKAIDSLQGYQRGWFLPYITIMASTGPLFLSLIWRHYNADSGLKAEDHVRLVFPSEYMGKDWSFFTHHLGNSWHKWDSDAIFWVSLVVLMYWNRANIRADVESLGGDHHRRSARRRWPDCGHLVCLSVVHRTTRPRQAPEPQGVQQGHGRRRPRGIA